MPRRLVLFRDGNGGHLVDRQLVAMAERVGVDLAATESPAQLEAMQRGCVRCRIHERCDDWLRSPDGTGYRRFCPNTDNLDRLWMRAAILFDDDRLQAASFKTAIHSDRAIRPRG